MHLILLSLLLLPISILAQVSKFTPETLIKYTLVCKPYIDDQTKIRIYMSLIIKENISYFMEDKMIDLDRQINTLSTSSKNFDDIQRELVRLPKPDIRSVVRKNMLNQNTQSNQLIGKNYYFYDITTSIKWEIESEKEKFLGFDVQKATCTYKGRNYIAWFSPQIPLPDGPYIFSGLPGLILKIHDDKMDYSYEATTVQIGVPQEQIHFHLFSNPIKVTKAEFQALKKSAQENVLATIESNPNISMSEENKRKILENAKYNQGKKLNPMELED